MKVFLRHYLNGVRIRATLRQWGVSKKLAKRIGMGWDTIISPLYVGVVEIKEMRRI